ncbi:acyltransferase family protein [Methanococcoides sp. SA1]|nr:acyltransferase family protein [Methanococcoides sp. SA1]
MRIYWVDSLKGIAILLVIVGHHSIPVELTKYIYSFHIPLFFFISGYLFNMKKHLGEPIPFIKKRFNQLIIPYFSFTLITYLFYFSISKLYNPNIQSILYLNKSIPSILYDIFYSIGPTLQLTIQLWFLTCLFVTEVLFIYIAKNIIRLHKSNDNALIVSVFIISIIGYIYSTYIPYRLPWGSDIAMTAILFYAGGYYYRIRYESRINQVKYVPFLLVVIHLFTFMIYDVDMNNRIYGNYFLFYISAFSGILSYITLFKKIGSFKVLEFLGKNTLIILGLHRIIKVSLKEVIALALNDSSISFENSYILTILLVGINLVVLVPFIIIINRYFPYILGKTRAN